MTPVPIELVIEAAQGRHERAAVPAWDLEHSTACVLVARKSTLLIACRTRGPEPDDPPSVATTSVDWDEVGIGPTGASGRVPGGLLGGAEATDHLLTIVAAERLFEARISGSRGPEAIASFVSVARQGGAGDFQP